MAYKPVTVSQVNAYIKQIFDAEELLYNISVVGEISGFNIMREAVYFTLKDEFSSLSCVSFNKQLFLDYKNGDSVLVVGTPKFYAKGGKLNFNVVNIEHYGESVLYKRFLELKASLQEQGYFDDAIKKEIPQNIKRIGVVSSETGAVIQDIINVRTRRNPAIDIVLFPVKVQGENAEYEIANGIKMLDFYNVDVIIVARGGGSFEDLQPFNTKVVADAVFYCNKPVVSAVGHETDFTIIDFVSDLRAPTPSAAAELLCSDVKQNKTLLINKIKQLNKVYANFYFNQYNNLFNNIKELKNQYDYLYYDINKNIELNVINFKSVLNSVTILFENNLRNKINLIEKLNPEKILKLGYASLKLNNEFITSVKNIKEDDKLEIKLKDGSVEAKVIKVRN